MEQKKSREKKEDQPKIFRKIKKEKERSQKESLKDFEWIYFCCFNLYLLILIAKTVVRIPTASIKLIIIRGFLGLDKFLNEIDIYSAAEVVSQSVLSIGLL